MPRRRRVDGVICHVFNRAAAKLRLFETSHDYRAFLAILLRTKQQSVPPLSVYGYCVMPNHWHLIICAPTTSALSHFMRLLTHRHAVSYIAAHPERSGAIYQGRFKCVPVQDGCHLSRLLLYVDRNPLRAKLVGRCEDWLWSSVVGHAGIESDPLLDELPPGTCGDWLNQVNGLDHGDAITRASLERGLPIGEPEWVAALSAEWSILRRPRGRPPRIDRTLWSP
jgi:putative transposase